MSTLVTSLREQIETDRDKAEAAYRKLVAGSIKGMINLSKVRHILETADRSPDQFEADIETLRQRHKAVEDIATSEGMDEAITTANAVAHEARLAVIELRERQKKEMEEANRKQWQLMYEADSLQDRQRRLRQSGRELLQGTADKAIIEEIERKQVEILTAERSLHPVMFQLTDLEQRRAQEIERHQMMYGDTVPVPEPNKSYKHFSSERDRLEKTIKDARARIQTLEAMKLDPENQFWATSE